MTNFVKLGFFIKASPGRAAAGFNKMLNLVEDDALMIVHIYAKVSVIKRLCLA
ncbi:hypothetical protein SPBRAN_43 [uncultured Candidatus Thioglobus sp.]|nr:hypothetical protein SPBRAN_43 [uncultured Candidatus Thioglobus sp.]